MGCVFFSGAFWGILLIVLGALLIVRVVFDINIPLFRIAFALLLIYFGIRVLVGGFGPQCRGQVMPRESTVRAHEVSPRYNVLFGKGVIDYSGLSLEQGTAAREVNVIFGEGHIRLAPDMPALVIVNAAFAGARLPDGSVVSFGTYTYRTKAFKENEKHLLIRANVVFGGLDIVEAAAAS